jgi:hypothetical protein
MKKGRRERDKRAQSVADGECPKSLMRAIMQPDGATIQSNAFARGMRASHRVIERCFLGAASDLSTVRLKADTTYS